MSRVQLETTVSNHMPSPDERGTQGTVRQRRGIHDITAGGISKLTFRPNVVIGIAVWALMSLAAAFHWFGTSVDFFNYLAFYNGLQHDLSVGYYRFEGGFVLVSWLYKFVFNAEYDVLSLSVVAASLGIKFYLFFRYLRSPLLAITVYLMIFYPLYEYTQIRAALSSALVYFAVHMFWERRHLTSALLLVGALAFHVSAIIVAVAVILFVFLRRPLGITVAFLAALAMMIWYDEIIAAATNLLPTINPLAAQYFDNILATELPNLWSVQNIFLIASILLVAASASEANKTSYYDSMFIFLSISGFVMLAIFINSPVLAQRGKELLTLSAIFLVFRGSAHTRAAPFALMLVCGGWSLYRAFSEGVLGG